MAMTPVGMANRTEIAVGVFGCSIESNVLGVSGDHPQQGGDVRQLVLICHLDHPLDGLIAFSSALSNFFKSKLRSSSLSFSSSARSFSLIGFLGFLERGTLVL